MDATRSPRPIAYLTMGFPVRSETAVVREMFVIDRERFPVHVFSVRPLAFGEGVYEPKADTFRGRAVGFSAGFAARSVASTARRLLRRDPGLTRVLEATLRGAGRHLPKALVVMVLANGFADEAQARGVAYVHGNFASFQAYAAWTIHALTGIPYGFTMHAHDLFIHGFLMREKAAEAAVVVSISEFNRRLVEERWGIAPEGVHIVRCGIDLDEFTPVERTRGPTLRLLSVGRLTAMKGFTFLLSALELLRDRPMELDLVGSGEDEAALRSQIERQGLGERVRIHTHTPQDELKALYHRADLYVQPSIRLADGLMEGVPATLMEAMAVGLPCVSTRLSGVPELVRDGETGLLVPPEDPRALADALRALDADPARCAAMGRRGRAVVEAEFDATLNARRLADLIGTALSRTPGVP